MLLSFTVVYISGIKLHVLGIILNQLSVNVLEYFLGFCVYM